MSEEITFVPIEYDDFKQKMNYLFGWNTQPLTPQEIMKSGSVMNCPACGHVRWAMSRAILPEPFVYTGKYCVCPEQKAGMGNE